jgi:hypothetical protein
MPTSSLPAAYEEPAEEPDRPHRPEILLTAAFIQIGSPGAS